MPNNPAPIDLPVINEVSKPFQYLFYHVKNPWQLDSLSSKGDQRLFDALNRLANNGTTIANTISTIINNGSAGVWVEEIPAGLVDGVNKVYTLSYTPIAGSLTLFLNIDQREGTNFRITATTITFTVAPKIRDTNPVEGSYFLARYQH